MLARIWSDWVSERGQWVDLFWQDDDYAGEVRWFDRKVIQVPGGLQLILELWARLGIKVEGAVSMMIWDLLE